MCLGQREASASRSKKVSKPAAAVRNPIALQETRQGCAPPIVVRYILTCQTSRLPDRLWRACMISESRLATAAERHDPSHRSPVATMRRFVRTRVDSAIARGTPERCELCSAELPPTHRHLFEMTK